MARCKLTRMNLRNIRKSREYQTLLIDLVALNVVGKSTAEELLGYTIPAGLLSANTVTSDDEETGGEGSGSGSEQGSGGESGTEGSGTVTLIHWVEGEGSVEPGWETSEYTLTGEDTTDSIIAAAKIAFEDDTINGLWLYSIDPDTEEYVEGQSAPETFENGMIIDCYHDGGK